MYQYKKCAEAANALYSVKPVEQYSGLYAQGVINLELIKSQKRAILRVLFPDTAGEYAKPT